MWHSPSGQRQIPGCRASHETSNNKQQGLHATLLESRPRVRSKTLERIVEGHENAVCSRCATAHFGDKGRGSTIRCIVCGFVGVEIGKGGLKGRDIHRAISSVQKTVQMGSELPGAAPRAT